MTIRLQLLIGFFTLIFVFVLVFFANQSLSQEVLTNTNYLNNSEAVIKNSNILHKEMIEMQSGFRGFLLTNQEVFLEPYYEGIKNVPVLLNEQQALLSTQHQKQKLDSIYRLHQAWVEYSDSLISTKKDTLPEAGIRYKKLFDTKLKMEVGKKLNDKIRAMFITLDNYEYTIRQERRIALQRSINNNRNTSLILLIASVLVGFISSIYFIRIITIRIAKLVNLAEKISQGNFITINDKKRDEFTKLVNSLNQMSETLNKNFNELKKKNKELDQFAYVVSHDLKAPLRGISNIISWMEEDHEKDITPEINQNLILIKGRTLRLENMINGLLEYARIEKTRKGIEMVNTDLMLKDLKELLIPSKFSLIIKNPLPIIHAEKLHIEQVFANLISNAVKYNNNEHPEIIIDYNDEGKYHQFSVFDNGPGIDKEYFGKIFEIFQTLQERDAFESTGVGLAIIKKIIDDNKGTINVESELGKGARFVFTWPKI
ncbi:MAG: CHASE3 domain-containing protein [Bacteroidetes bacterium]|nr:CHASE3 domain-containing protein [Bacteroidota bacterium]